jgi:hypothetical protein
MMIFILCLAFQMGYTQILAFGFVVDYLHFCIVNALVRFFRFQSPLIPIPTPYCIALRSTVNLFHRFYRLFVLFIHTFRHFSFPGQLNNVLRNG